MTDTDIGVLLLLVAVLLLCTWVAYRHEREHMQGRIKDMRSRPSASEALLSAIVASARRIEASADRIEVRTRPPAKAVGKAPAKRPPAGISETRSAHKRRG